MIKLFVSDMDGTLLNEAHVISERTARAIKKLQQAGIEFVIATGRPYNSAKPLLDAHGIKCKMINLNGAAVYDFNGKIETKIPIESDTSEAMLDHLTETNTGYSIMTEDYFYVNDKAAFLKRMEDVVRKMRIEAQTHVKTDDALSSDAQFLHELNYIRGIEEYPEDNSAVPLKFMVFGSQEDGKLADFKLLFNSYRDIDITSSGPDNLEVTHSRAQKGFAVQDYAVSRGIVMEDVLTIGDSLNDRSMLKMAGHSYSMANADPQVKAMAKFEAPSHREDGVAQIIEHILSETSL